MDSAIKLDSFDHVGVVVKDREATMKSWSALLSVGPWTTRDSPFVNMAWGYMGKVQFELLQPREDKSVWAKHLAVHGEGIHHVCSRVPHVDNAVAELEKKGGKKLIGGGTWAYVEIGGPGSIVLELLNTPPEK
jgi:hypothetical protein